MFSSKGRISFDRNELAGAFGDLGTDLPLVLGMVVINQLDIPSTFIMFGLLQVLTGLRYGLPMPVQPLKAIAAIMITTRPDKSLVYGAGLVLGISMLLLSSTGLLSRLHELIPRSVVRGIQFGLGLSLMIVAMSFMQRDAMAGLLLSLLGVIVVLVLYNNRRVPAALVLVAVGVVFALLQGFDLHRVVSGLRLSLPAFNVPSSDAMWLGGLILGAPQLPLSLANSVIAITLLVRDLFPQRNDVTIKKIGMTYGLMNVVAPFFSGIPVCHGAGGLAGHHRFGARTGGSVLIEGSVYMLLGVFLASAVSEVTKLFPFPILGVLLFFEGFSLVQLIRHVTYDTNELYVALMVGAIIIGLPYGYLIGLIAGTALFRILQARRLQL